MRRSDDAHWYEWQREDWYVAFERERPITVAVYNLLFSKYLSMVLDGPLVPERLGIIAREMRELSNLIAPPGILTEQDVEAMIDSSLKGYAEAGCPPLQLVKLSHSIPASLRRKPGRPVALTREMATRFLEAKTKDARLSYVRFMNKNCKCGKQSHALCGATLRQQVIRLKKTLKKYGIPYPPTQST